MSIADSDRQYIKDKVIPNMPADHRRLDSLEIIEPGDLAWNSGTCKFEAINETWAQQKADRLFVVIRKNPDHIIPPITHELGKFWEAPNREDILVDDMYALMTKKDFDSLLDYSGSMPTGAYEGKMWKVDLKWRDPNDSEWILAWFDISDKPDMLSTKWRHILIV